MFYLDLSLFYIIVISFFEQFTLRFNKTISGTNIGWSSLEAKERGLGKNMMPPSQKFGTARAKCGTAVPPLRIPLAAFSSPASYTVL